MRNVYIEAFRRASLVVLHDLAWRWFGIPSPEVRAARQQRAEAEARAHEEAVRAWQQARQQAMQPARDLGMDEQQAAIWTDLARSAAAGPLVPCYGSAPLQPLQLYPEFARFFPAWTPPAPAGGLEHACDAVRADMLDRVMKARTAAGWTHVGQSLRQPRLVGASTSGYFSWVVDGTWWGESYDNISPYPDLHFRGSHGGYEEDGYGEIHSRTEFEYDEEADCLYLFWRRGG